MSIYGELKVQGVASTDIEDMIAAFSGEECVGVASPYYVERYGKYELFIRVYGNDDSSSDLTFRIWDASTGDIYPATSSEKISYVPNGLYG